MRSTTHDVGRRVQWSHILPIPVGARVSVGCHTFTEIRDTTAALPLVNNGTRTKH
jgi:hypothetical protein